MRSNKEKNFHALVSIYSVLQIWDKDIQEKTSDEEVLLIIEDIFHKLKGKKEPVK